MPTIRIGHRPGADDAFRFSGIATGRITIGDAATEHVLEDVESLNRRARDRELEITTISAATYSLVADGYRLLDAGASMRKQHGPILVSREPIDVADIPERVVAIPGSHTTASLLLRLYTADEPALIEVAPEKIAEAVVEGQADLGLLVHEAILTYASRGLVCVLDLGEAWRHETDLPLPLGVTAVRRDLGEAMHDRVSQAVCDSIAWARANADEAFEYALRHLRRADREIGRRFVSVAVNEYSSSLGDAGRSALERLYREAHRRGLIPGIPPLDPA
jgi:1,4-dihydroxy-6-naphthoate synthase